MEDHILEYLKELNNRLQANGFSFWVSDFLDLKEALPKILELLQESDSEHRCKGCGAIITPEDLCVDCDQLASAEKCTHPSGYISTVRICGLCGEQL